MADNPNGGARNAGGNAHGCRVSTLDRLREIRNPMEHSARQHFQASGFHSPGTPYNASGRTIVGSTFGFADA